MKTKVWMLATMLVASMWTITAAAMTVADRDCCAVCSSSNCDDCCASPCCADKSCCSDACC